VLEEEIGEKRRRRSKGKKEESMMNTIMKAEMEIRSQRHRR
jgi:hypothetical protein